MMDTHPKKDGGRKTRMVVSLSPDSSELFRSLADAWGMTDTEVASRLVRFASSLELDGQQLVLGLPVAADRFATSVACLVDGLRKRTKDSSGN